MLESVVLIGGCVFFLVCVFTAILRWLSRSRRLYGGAGMLSALHIIGFGRIYIGIIVVIVVAVVLAFMTGALTQ